MDYQISKDVQIFGQVHSNIVAISKRLRQLRRLLADLIFAIEAEVEKASMTVIAMMTMAEGEEEQQKAKRMIILKLKRKDPTIIFKPVSLIAWSIPLLSESSPVLTAMLSLSYE